MSRLGEIGRREQQQHSKTTHLNTRLGVDGPGQTVGKGTDVEDNAITRKPPAPPAEAKHGLPNTYNDDNAGEVDVAQAYPGQQG